MDDIALVIRHCKRSKEIKLDLSNRSISSIPQDVSKLFNLEILDLSSNQITQINFSLT